MGFGLVALAAPLLFWLWKNRAGWSSSLARRTWYIHNATDLNGSPLLSVKSLGPAPPRVLEPPLGQPSATPFIPLSLCCTAVGVSSNHKKQGALEQVVGPSPFVLHQIYRVFSIVATETARRLFLLPPLFDPSTRTPLFPTPVPPARMTPAAPPGAQPAPCRKHV